MSAIATRTVKTSSSTAALNELLSTIKGQQNAVKSTAAKLSHEIALRARKARREAGLSRFDAGDLLGVQPHVITMMEEGHSTQTNGALACERRIKLLNKLEAFAQKAVALKKEFAPAA